jgi:hypothetical protein
MIDREKVICDLQILRTWCAVDPIYGIGLTCRECEKAVGWLDDVLELLKAQEPRVLTLEEVRSKQTKAIPVWKETKSKNKALYAGWVLAYEVQTGQGITGDCLGMAEPSGRMVWYKLSDYGKTWRCWNKRPTEEQREAVKWNG